MWGEQNGDVGSDRAHAEKAATFTGMVAVVVLAIGMMMGRSVLMHVHNAGILMVVGQAVRGDGSRAEGHDGGRCRQTQRIKHGKQNCRAPTPSLG